jgi:peptidoglycan hydrolase CwlO-like protein
MTIELALLVSVISVAFGVYQGIANMKRNEKVDERNDASQLTTVIVKLENIGTGITEIKSEISSLKKDTKEDHERIIRLEEAIKSAHERINKLEESILGGDRTR